MRDALIRFEVWITPRPMAPHPKTATVEPAIGGLAATLAVIYSTH